MNRSLILCMTPLHVLMVRLLVKHTGRPFSTAVYLAQRDNDKARHYGAELRALAEAVHYRIMDEEHEQGWAKYVAIWRRRRRFNAWLQELGRFDAIYVPSSLNDYLYAVATHASVGTLRTYDDGLLNINPQSQIITQPVSARNKLFLLACGVHQWPERIIEQSVEHFTTYPVPNVYKRVTRLPWRMQGVDEPIPEGYAGRHETILIGAAPEAPRHVREVIARFDVEHAPDWYLPHPRDTDLWSGKSKPLQTPLIIEDHILSVLDRDPALRFSVVGYESSALVNLAHVPRVSSFTLMDCSESGGVAQLMLQCGVQPWK